MLGFPPVSPSITPADPHQSLQRLESTVICERSDARNTAKAAYTNSLQSRGVEAEFLKCWEVVVGEDVLQHGIGEVSTLSKRESSAITYRCAVGGSVSELVPRGNAPRSLARPVDLLFLTSSRVGDCREAGARDLRAAKIRRRSV